MKATEQYFPVGLFIMLYKVVLTFESADELQSVTIQMKVTEKFFPVVLLLCSTRCASNVLVCLKSESVTIQIKATEENPFPVVLFIVLYKVVLTFESLLWMKS